MKKEIIFYKKGFRVDEDGNLINPKGIQISGNITYHGYIKTGIRYNGKTLNCMVHRLQAYQKYGDLLFYEGVETRHKNGIKTDNSYNNILIGTRSKNQMDIPKAVRMSRSLHATSFVRKYNKKEVKDFHKENGNSYKKTMEHFNISSKGSLHYVLNK